MSRVDPTARGVAEGGKRQPHTANGGAPPHWDAFPHYDTAIDDSDAEVPAPVARRGEPHPIINRADRDGMTPLVAAVSGLGGVVRLPIFRLLLAAGADVNVITPGPSAIVFGSAFLAAVRSGRVPVVDLLLANGADARVRNPVHNGTAMHEAASSRSMDMARRVMALDLPVDDVKHDGTTPLMIAAGQDYPDDFAAAFIAAGAAVNTRDARGNTALHAASIAGATRNIRALVAAGADVNARNNAGQTPADVAAEGAYVEDSPPETWEELRGGYRASVLAALAGLPEPDET